MLIVIVTYSILLQNTIVVICSNLCCYIPLIYTKCIGISCLFYTMHACVTLYDTILAFFFKFYNHCN